MMLHFGHGDQRGIGITQNHHAKRIAHQDQWNTGFIEQLRRREIIGRQGRNLWPPFFMAEFRLQ